MSQAPNTPTQKIDLVDNIMAYEDGQLDADKVVIFFQYLIDTGLAWTLQGHYGRAASQLIATGHCTRA